MNTVSDDVTVKEVVAVIMDGTTQGRKEKIDEFGKRAKEFAEGVKGFNVRALGDPDAMRQLGWLTYTQSRVITTSAKIDGRVKQQSLDNAGFREFLQELMEAIPALQLPSVIDEKPPQAWTWTEFNGRTLANPWAKETQNLSQQAWLEKNQPKLAEFLKIEANGGPNYQQLHEERTRKAQLKEANEYEGPNPWRETEEPDWTLTARTEAKVAIVKANPILAEQLEAEARGIIVNPWSGAGHMTRQVEVAKKNRGLANLMRVAALHEKSQLHREADEARDVAAKAQFEAVQAGNRAAALRRRVA